MLRRRYRDRISLVEFINCVMASGARLPVQIEKNPLYASHAALPVRVAFASHSLFLRSSPYSLLPPFFTLSPLLVSLFFQLYSRPSFFPMSRRSADTVEPVTLDPRSSRGKLIS